MGVGENGEDEFPKKTGAYIFSYVETSLNKKTHSNVDTSLFQQNSLYFPVFTKVDRFLRKVCKGFATFTCEQQAAHANPSQKTANFRKNRPDKPLWYPIE